MTNEKELFERLEAEIASKFLEPEYRDFQLTYVSNSKEADVKISTENNIFDFLAIGIVALSKLANGDTSNITITYGNYYSIKISKLLSSLVSLRKSAGRPLYPNALSDLLEQSTIVLQKYFTDEQYPVSIAGVLLCTTVTSIVMGYQENFLEIDLKVSNFDDNIVAQKLAFTTLKKLVISNYLGSMAQLFSEEE